MAARTDALGAGDRPSRAPRLVAVSTDGLSKSFASDRGFLQFMAGLDERLSAEGADTVRAVLPEWLAKASQHSGDDTTLVAAWHPAPPAATGAYGTCGAAGTYGATGATTTDAAPPTDPYGRDE